MKNEEGRRIYFLIRGRESAEEIGRIREFKTQNSKFKTQSSTLFPIPYSLPPIPYLSFYREGINDRFEAIGYFLPAIFRGGGVEGV